MNDAHQQLICHGLRHALDNKNNFLWLLMMKLQFFFHVFLLSTAYKKIIQLKNDFIWEILCNP